MKNKLTVSIGIPLYNEEKNILKVLTSITQQKFKQSILKEIILVSDGCTDNTVKAIKDIKNKKIILIEGKIRKGVNFRKNDILKRAKGDILVFLNGDVILDNNNTIYNLIKPIIKNSKIKYTSGLIKATKPRNFFEKIIYDSHNLKLALGVKIKNGNNIYMSYGGIQAVEKVLYSKLIFPNNTPEDAFIYLYCKKAGYKFKYVNTAKVLFRLPSKFEDHKRQSIRFQSGIKSLYEYFDKKQVTNEYDIPKSIFYKTLFEYFFQRPLTTCCYLLLTTYLRLISKRSIFLSKWDIALSSKEVVS